MSTSKKEPGNDNDATRSKVYPFPSREEPQDPTAQDDEEAAREFDEKMDELTTEFERGIDSMNARFDRLMSRFDRMNRFIIICTIFAGIGLAACLILLYYFIPNK